MLLVVLMTNVLRRSKSNNFCGSETFVSHSTEGTQTAGARTEVMRISAAERNQKEDVLCILN
jgi:hypothetical protein